MPENMPENEILMLGGNVNAGVVRVGDTVRRTTTPASPTIHRLLLHLEAKGFAGSPRFLGVDPQGREKLSFLEGETGIPSAIWQSEEPLIAVAALLRRYHDATLDFDHSDGDVWAKRPVSDGRSEVICHNDFAPYNFIYAAGLPWGVIDFDLAGPGPRLRDVAYAAYWMVPLSFHSADQQPFAEADLRNGSYRCRLFCDTYGIAVTGEFFDMIANVLAFMGDEEVMRQLLGGAAAAKLKAEGHLAHWQGEALAFADYRPQIEDNLLERRTG